MAYLHPDQSCRDLSAGVLHLERSEPLAVFGKSGRGIGDKRAVDTFYGPVCLLRPH